MLPTAGQCDLCFVLHRCFHRIDNLLPKRRIELHRTSSFSAAPGPTAKIRAPHASFTFADISANASHRRSFPTQHSAVIFHSCYCVIARPFPPIDRTHSPTTPNRKNSDIHEACPSLPIVSFVAPCWRPEGQRRRPNRRRQGAERRWSSLFLVLNGIGLQKRVSGVGRAKQEAARQAGSKQQTKNTHHLEVLPGPDRG